MTEERESPEPEDAASEPSEPSETSAPTPPAKEDEATSAPAEAAAEPASAPKKKKKRKEMDAEPESAADAVVDDSPEGKSLKEAQTAFAIGDYQTARTLAQKLLASNRATIADAARDLLRRTDVDPAQMIFLAACACALIGVAFYYLR